MEKETLDEYESILRIFITHYNNGSKTPLTPKEIKNHFGIGKKSDSEYEQKKRSLDRCMEFYSLIKLISIYTDTTMNEINRLKRIRKKHSYKITNTITKEKRTISIPLHERKELDPYIEYVGNIRKKTLTKNECDLYNTVGRFRKTKKIWIDDKDNEIDEDILKGLPKYIHPNTNIIFSTKDTSEEKKEKEKNLNENCLNPLRKYPTDKNGFFVINEKLKFKQIEKKLLSFEFIGNKFKNIDIDVNKDFTDNENKKRNLLKDVIIIDNEKVTLVDIADTSVRAEDCLYRLNQPNKCNSNPINYVIPADDKIDLFVDFLDRMIDRKINDDGVYNRNITSRLVSTVINSNAFGFQTNFVAETVGKLLIEKHNKLKIQYTLPLLIEIIESKNKIDIEFKNNGNNIKLQNTQIKQITVKENSFDLVFDNFISMNQSDILQIKSITNSNENELSSDYYKLKELVNELDEKYKLTFEFIMMEFDYKELFEF